jgi:succinate dehydrogenase subunit C
VSTSDAIGRGGEEPASRAEIADAAPPGSRAYPNQLPTNWWRRNRRYLLYMVREFTAVPIAVWMIWFLVEIASARGGAAGYKAPGGVAFVAFSAVCLLFALWHSFTFLRLSGLIVRIPLGQRTVPAPVIVGGSFALLVVASVVVGGLLMWGGR